ncbi:MAG: hypothetical protein A2032_01470 [Chloroflexi bacterium RBG_19FT_COMBO_49_13]|nr:MAG: hypothetical protein A2032_01470 [Chloroflexi bacterium RBG_19FT_COMBO_49_13]
MIAWNRVSLPYADLPGMPCITKTTDDTSFTCIHAANLVKHQCAEIRARLPGGTGFLLRLQPVVLSKSSLN